MSFRQKKLNTLIWPILKTHSYYNEDAQFQDDDDQGQTDESYESD